MVSLSRSISNKIRERQGDITEDETVQFKAHLLSLGIDDPVTREGSKSSSQYYAALGEDLIYYENQLINYFSARQISELLFNIVQESNGQLTLPDAYCRVNRARGMDLISPDDLLRACQSMESLQLPLRLRKLTSGVLVLQLASLNDESLAKDTSDQVRKTG